jgi:hypothetical protein
MIIQRSVEIASDSSRAAPGGGSGLQFSFRPIGNGCGRCRKPLSYKNCPLREPAENTTLLESRFER